MRRLAVVLAVLPLLACGRETTFQEDLAKIDQQIALETGHRKLTEAQILADATKLAEQQPPGAPGERWVPLGIAPLEQPPPGPLPGGGLFFVRERDGISFPLAFVNRDSATYARVKIACWATARDRTEVGRTEAVLPARQELIVPGWKGDITVQIRTNPNAPAIVDCVAAGLRLPE